MSVLAPLLLQESGKHAPKRSDTRWSWFFKREKSLRTKLDLVSMKSCIKNGSELVLLSSPKDLSLGKGNKSLEKKRYSVDDERSFSNKSPLESPMDVISPVPVDIYNCNSAPDTKALSISRIIEELAESEKTYIYLLELLLKYYISPLQADKTKPCADSLNLTGGLISHIIELHRSFSQEIRQEMFGNDGSFLLSTILSKLRNLTLNYYIYTYYCVIFENVLEFYSGCSSTMCNDTPVFPTKWFKGLGRFLEATQPSSKKHDLSFISLIQRPTARYGKYRLFLEAISKQLKDDSSSRAYHEVKSTLEEIKQRLQIINHDAKYLKEADKSKAVNELIDFLGLGIDLSFFSSIHLIGCLSVCWVERNGYRSGCFTVIVFKSHLLLINSTGSWRKNQPPKFLIPLAKAKIVVDMNQWDGGMYSRYPYSFKIVYEKGFCQYEILLAAISNREYVIWKNQLETLINVVNGPYKMDFSAGSGLDLVTSEPETLCPSSISLKLKDTKKKIDCYFRAPISIGIHNMLLIRDDQELHIGIAQDFLVDHYTYITRHERVRIEKRLEGVWSQELPRFIDEELHKIKRHLSLPRISFFRRGTETSTEVNNEVVNETPSSSVSHDVRASLTGDVEIMYTARTTITSRLKSSGILSRESTRRSLTRVFRSKSDR